MKKTYKRASFLCVDYDDMIETFNQNYADHYRLIGYRLFKSTETSQKAILVMYPISKEKENGERN